MKLRILMLSMALGVAACGSTPYQDEGLTGGVTVEYGADGTALVRAMGNGYSTEEAMGDYATLKAAELTLAANEKCFEILSFNTQMDAETYAGQYGVYTSMKPSARLRFRILTGEQMCDAKGDAQAIADRLRPKVADRSNYNKNNAATGK